VSALRVVIADDQPMMRAGFKAVLEATGNIQVVAEAGSGEEVDAAEIEAAVVRAAGGPPRELRLLRTEHGVVAFLTLGLEPGATLEAAHARASEVEERLRRARPDVADVIVHTEP